MMQVIVPDVNLLLYAYDDTSPFHARARQWWEDVMSGDELVGLTHPVLFAFLRISTNPRAYVQPLSLEQAAAYVATWLVRQVARVLQPDIDHVRRVLELLRGAASSGGNLVTDAQVAALALAYNGTVYTADHDFARFSTVDSRYPLES